MQQLIEGTTEAIRTKLFVDGVAAPVDGKTYKLWLTPSGGGTARTIDTNGGKSGLDDGCTFAVATEDGDAVASFTPVAATLLAGAYRVRFQNVTDGFFLPNDEAGETWFVYKP